MSTPPNNGSGAQEIVPNASAVVPKAKRGLLRIEVQIPDPDDVERGDQEESDVVDLVPKVFNGNSVR